MQNQNRKLLISQLLIQVVITVLYTIGFVEILLFNGRNSGLEGLVEPTIKYFPFLIILICSILPQGSLLIKHKLHSQDGEILPLLFSVVCLQASLIVSEAMDASGYLFLFPYQLIVLQRFSLLSSASMFLLSSLRYYGFSSSNIGLYNFVFLAVPFLLSAIIPFSSYEGQTLIYSSFYEVYLEIAITIIYVASIITFIFLAIKDKTSLNVKRSISFIFISIGLYLSQINELWAAITSSALYIIGTIILVINAGDSL